MNLSLKMTSFLMNIVLISCTTNHKKSIVDPVNNKIDTMKPEGVKRWTLIRKDKNFQIEASSNVSDTMIQSVWVKFEPYVWFEDFPAKTIDTVSKAPLDFSTNQDAKYYITAIKTGYKAAGSTFGGHYELIMWACGFPCAHGVIVDRKTGRMVHLPESQSGYEYWYNSRMLIVNPTDENGFYNLMDDYVAPPSIYVFDEVKKEFKLLEPRGR